MASPAVTDHALILRTKTHLYRIEWSSAGFHLGHVAGALPTPDGAAPATGHAAASNGSNKQRKTRSRRTMPRSVPKRCRALQIANRPVLRRRQAWRRLPPPSRPGMNSRRPERQI